MRTILVIRTSFSLYQSYNTIIANINLRSNVIIEIAKLKFHG